MIKLKKIFMFFVAFLLSCMIFSNETMASTKSGGVIIKSLYETEKELRLALKGVAEPIDNSKIKEQRSKIWDVMENNTEYSQYYGGTYTENNKLVILLTEINNSTISFCAETIGDKLLDINSISSCSAEIFGDNVIYRKCDVSMQELKEIDTHVIDFVANYEYSLNEAMNELVHSFVSCGVDVRKNAVSISLENCDENRIALFKEQISDSEHIIFEISERIVDAMEVTDVADTAEATTLLTVGSEVRKKVDGGYGSYSLGFRCRRLKSDGSYEYGFVTAGHQNVINDNFYSPDGRNIGYVALRSYINNGKVDASYIVLTDSDYTITSYVLNYPNENLTSGAIDTVCDVEDEIYTCGYRSKLLLGEIEYISRNVQVNYSDGSSVVTKDVYQVSNPTTPGDSGAIAYTVTNGQRQIAGIIKGGNSAASYIVKIENILNVFSSIKLY